MAATWLRDTAEYLEDQLVGTVGTNIFMGFMPPTPTACVVLYDAGGTYQPQGIDVPWSEHRLEVRVRAETHAAATTLANSALTALDHKAALTMNSSTVVHWLRPEHPPAILEYDHQRRAIMLIRFTMQVQRNVIY